MFFVAEKAAKNYSNFFFRFINRNRIIQIMEYQRVLNLLNEPNDFKFVTRKWNIVNYQLNANYDVGNGSIYKYRSFKI